MFYKRTETNITNKSNEKEEESQASLAQFDVKLEPTPEKGRILSAPPKYTKLTKKQESALKELFREREKALNKPEGGYTNYLINTGLFKYVTKLAEQKQKSSDKLIRNVNDLIAIAGKFESLSEFYDQVSLFSGDSA